jgi:hypothetical protein
MFDGFDYITNDKKEEQRKKLDPLADLEQQMCLTWVYGCLFGFACMVGMYVLLTICPECRA